MPCRARNKKNSSPLLKKIRGERGGEPSAVVGDGGLDADHAGIDAVEQREPLDEPLLHLGVEVSRVEVESEVEGDRLHLHLLGRGARVDQDRLAAWRHVDVVAAAAGAAETAVRARLGLARPGGSPLADADGDAAELIDKAGAIGVGSAGARVGRARASGGLGLGLELGLGLAHTFGRLGSESGLGLGLRIRVGSHLRWGRSWPRGTDRSVCS